MANINAIDKRYSDLAEKSCCLSCGGAIGHADIKQDEFCLDIGSGRGNDVLRMAETVGKGGFVYGLDISEGMLKKAQKAADAFKVENVKFLKSEIEVIPIEDSLLDVVISNCTINHAQDKEAVWSEIFRVLKPGGRFIVSDIYSAVKVPDIYRNDPEAVAECWAGSVTKEEYMNTLVSLGFKNIQIIEESNFYNKGKIEVASFTVRGYK